MTRSGRVPNGKFPIGRVVVTPGMGEAWAQNGGPALWRFLECHAQGDWGDVNEHDREANETALREGLRIWSVYHLKDGARFWIITEADRSSTTLLLPGEEY